MKLTTTMLSQLTRQDVFDIAAWHLLRQNARATGFDGVKCLYRAPDGKRCAIGWLIPDDVYAKTLEYFGVRDLAARLIEGEHAKFARFLYVHMTLLRDLQEMHDAQLPSEWPVALRAIARDHGLNTRVLGDPVPRPVAPAYLLDLASIVDRKPVFSGADYGSEEREASREVCCA